MPEGWRKTVSNLFIIPQRFVLVFMGFLAVANAYTMRNCLSIAITRMVKEVNTTGPINTEQYCPHITNDTSHSKHHGDFDWSEEFQGIILSSFYYGYVITHLPGGILAEKFGAKWVLSLGILSTAIFTLLTPLAIELGGPTALITLRVFMGIGEGTTYPALTALLARWIPLRERSIAGSIVYSGGQMGSILGTLIPGFLLDHFEGWSVVFYFFGIVAIFWFISFALLCYSDPDSHPFIKDSEKEFLATQLGQLKRSKDLPLIPWKQMFTNKPMLALLMAQIGHDYGFFTMATDLPKYMKNVLHFSVKDNGIFSSLPFILMWLVSIMSGFLVDFLISRKIMSITNARKFFTCVAAVGPAIFIVLASYAGCSRTTVVVLFTIAMGLMGTFYSGMKVNAIDLSPNYAGTIMAIINGIGAITGMIAPYVVGALTPNRSLTEWRSVFWIAFVIFVITSIIYGIWASGEVQPFNDRNEKPDSSRDA